MARIDEPPGSVDNYTPEQRKAIKDSIMKGGRLTNYNQKFALNYSVPINKIPMLDWVTLQATYSGEYHWTAAPTSIADVGNLIENANNKQLNASANLITLYNKISYLKKLNETNKQQNKTARPEDRYKNEGVPAKDKNKNKSANKNL